ncbi:rhamnogalacturonan acetylesterase [Paenibacillus aceris]|uniref:Lysophospholipase L1-like esterase n=1 Tax=Paenibacillus aceris TaxID=869555 RepID=A0ABS4HSH0_9BACL|nr:GDSL-type esterase/lipase family protein [Paenibacillus aceris]MBP1961538.1 lysophospholipase L1-like esterase [Paenibacillus aceris]NHW37685.1 GDSL family lipase [Paenibacillus aceris]
MSIHLRFDFGPEQSALKEGYTKVSHGAFYNEKNGYGFLKGSEVYERDRGRPEPLRQDFCIPVGAVFAVDLPNGNYTIHTLMGDLITATSTGLKAGQGRLLLSECRTAAGEFVSNSFSVHVEDGQLRLAFSGAAPRINALEIVSAPLAATLYLVGDSTVTDQPHDGYPYTGWGQMLPLFIKADAAVANYAVSGRSSKSFLNEGRFAPILDKINANDYLFIQFGHNDQKLDAERATSPFTTYKEHLTIYIQEARARGAVPILVTPVQRRFFDHDGKIVDTHGDYTTAMKQLAEEEDVILIDLAEESKQLFESMGVEETKSLFMWAWPGEFPNFPKGAEDNTHFQEKGGIAIAELVVACIRKQHIQPLQRYLR